MAMGQALSTSPGLGTPNRSEQAEWLATKYRRDTRRVTLSSGAMVSVPLLFWEARALTLEGRADADTVDGIFGSQDLRAWRDASGKASVTLWAPDYAGTSVGPLKSVFATVRVEPQSNCGRAHRNLQHHWWWWYYGNSVVNQEFKEQVWGVRNQLGLLETTYETDAKAARLLENGRAALRLRLDLARVLQHDWALVRGDEGAGTRLPRPSEQGALSESLKYLAKSPGNERLIDRVRLDESLAELAKLSNSHVARWQAAEEEKEEEADRADPEKRAKGSKVGAAKYDEGPPPFRFVSVSHRPNAKCENEVEMFGAAKLNIEFDNESGNEGRGDECEWGKDTFVGKELERVGFKPALWTYYASYSGVVKIYDGKGSNVRPEREDEEYARKVGQGLLRTIPELKREPQ